ncbi:MAG TPA: hypothetical protein VN494_06290, partial [Patescibacteria group bacterium]|nr:hypothetical protein [Patescibacteria group bacterium]
MKWRMSFTTVVLLAMVLGSLQPAAAAQVKAKAGIGNWDAAATWQGGVVPGAGDDVIIPAGSAVNVDGTKTIKSLAVAGT